jgi:V/A-type H+-transporting ATPase subunit I
MRWRDAVSPVPMNRIAVVAPEWALRDMLVRVAETGNVELDRLAAHADLPVSEAARRLQRATSGKGAAPAGSALAAHQPDLDRLERMGRTDLLAGEAELAERGADAVVRDDVAAMLGWAPTAELPALARQLADIGGAAVALERPRGVEPPTAARPGPVRSAFAPLVRTYTTVPYEDVDPTILAGVAYLVMFGAMFGDVGHGLLLLAFGLLVRWGRWRRLAALRPYWMFLAGAGLSATAFGFAYGECFGPTGLVPAGLIAPMESPVQLLVAGVGLGAVLLAGSYVLGTVNRVREGGWGYALYAPSGLAGAALFLAAGLGVWAVVGGVGWLGLVAGTLAVAALVFAFIGLFSAAGGGGGGVAQAVIELFDFVIRLGTNVISFARLAAFGLTHAVLGWVVWNGTTALWQAGGASMVWAVLLFVVGNAVALGLEALVAGVQALRLEYYELFSRVFQSEGRPFRPWHVPVDMSYVE